MVKKQKAKKDNESFGKWLLQVLVMAAILLGIYYLIFNFVLSNDTVSGPSMEPTFESGDRLITTRNSAIKRGEIIVFKAPDEPGALYIKRVIGLPGDTVSSKNDVTYINGKPIKEPYLNAYKKKLAPNTLYTNNFSLKKLFGVTRVPKGSYFVMGDHRDVSKDSRMIGFIKKSAIIGRVRWRYYPFNQMKFF